MKTVKFWFENARWVSLPQSMMPALVAVALAWSHRPISPLLAVAAVVGVAMAHLAMNLFDDYFDFKKHDPGVRDTLSRAGMRARVGKCAYITEGRATAKQLLLAALAFGAASVLLGAVISVFRGPPILWVVLVTALLGLSYSAEPLRLSYRGLGEITIGVIFGPLVIVGVYLSSCGALDWTILLIGAALGFLVTDIVYTHSVLDLEADRSVGKRTLAVLIPSAAGRLTALYTMSLAPFVLIVLGVVTGWFSVWYLLTFLALPMSVGLIREMHAFVKEPSAPVIRRSWYGPMQKWTQIEQAGIQWFMVRWYLARNLVTAFSLLCIVAAILTRW